MSECKPTLQMYSSLFVTIDLLTKERDEAIKQRDEARREICNSKKRRPKTHLDYARKRGWNCFWVDYSKQQEMTP